MEEEKKYLYCPTCKKYPDNITEKYLDPVIEAREWDSYNGDYGLNGSNMEEITHKQYCAECNSELIHKPQNEQN